MSKMYWYMQIQSVGFGLVPYNRKQKQADGLYYLGFLTCEKANRKAWEEYEKLNPVSDELWIGCTD